ncbi:protein FAM98A-like [Wyeomyia smithii]|uniref:protein FAM98A-like n=1 Tax=Wyeomyia smithii TaxID=174621 RepID=UPI002467BFB1|nr:protein FAM98A-like [Wyeomyia smithii]XP_055533271.1 protein FAM98A-like [Wyeomyia smithii]
MEEQLLSELGIVGYDGPFLEQTYASTAIAAGAQSPAFQELVIWLTDEIRILGKLDEKISKSEDASTFILELSGFLKELTCPYANLISGHVSDRLQTYDSKMVLLEYLLNELMAFKMIESLQKPKEKTNVITLFESPTAAALKDISITLGMGKPPNNIPAKVLFEKINVRLNDTIRIAGEKRLSCPLFAPKKNLTMEQWNKLDRLQKDLDTEYDLRRKMLLTRLDVTIQSFKWSTRVKGKEGTMSERYAEKRKLLDSLQTGGRDTDLGALLGARETLAIIEKTSSAAVRKNTKSKIQRHIIGRVPDRGGRAYEHNPPPLEMPSWQTQRSTGGPGGGGQRGGFSGGRGGQQNRGGGGYQQQGNYSQGSYNQGQGGFNQGGSGGGSYQQNQNRGGGGGGYSGNSRVQGGWSQPQKDYNQSYSSNSSVSGYSTGSGRGFTSSDQYSNSSGGSGYRGGSSSGGGHGGQGDQQYSRNNSYDGNSDRGFDNDYNRGGGRGGNNGGGGRSNYNRGGRR